jgi:hypothetical protein
VFPVRPGRQPARRRLIAGDPNAQVSVITGAWAVHQGMNPFMVGDFPQEGYAASRPGDGSRPYVVR